MFKKGIGYLILIQIMLMSLNASAATALPLEDQGGGVVKFLSNQSKYYLVYGFASIEGNREHLGYLALEHQGSWISTDATGNPTDGYSITRLGFKGEAFEYRHLHKANLHTGAKFDLYVGDTRISPDYHWQALGFGFGYIFTPIKPIVGLQLTAGINTEPGIFRINGKSFDEYQLQPYGEIEYFISPNFALMVKYDAIFTGDLVSIEQRVTDYWMGLRLFF